MIWSVEIVPLARAQTPGPEVFFQRAFGQWVEIGIHAFLLRSPGRLVVVDTGLPTDIAPLNQTMQRRKGPQAGFYPTGAGLQERLDRAPDALLLTSFGPYAVGGLLAFAPSIPIYASARGLRDLRDPEEPAFRHPLPPAISERLLNVAEPLAGEVEVLPGLRFLETGIHHPASAAVLVQGESGVSAIADPVFTRENLVEGIALGAAEHAQGWFRMVRSLGARGASIFPIHDPRPAPIGADDWATVLRSADG